METSNIQQLRTAFFAHRNGILAQGLRAAGSPHRFIMGCMLSDIMAITAGYPKDAELARALWADRDHRECRLAAAMLFPPEQLGEEEAHRWAVDVVTEEEADVLCHRLLRHHSEAPALACRLIESENPLTQYTGWRLVANCMAIRAMSPSPTLLQRARAIVADASQPMSLRQVTHDILEP